jgi:AbrB family looped-hinge helix DNA binding protein
MAQIATITSKRQLTIPVSIFRKLGLMVGQKVIVAEEKGTISIKPVLDLIEDLAGSVKTPGKYEGLSVDEIISQAKKDYFSKQ